MSSELGPHQTSIKLIVDAVFRHEKTQSESVVVERSCFPSRSSDKIEQDRYMKTYIVSKFPWRSMPIR